MIAAAATSLSQHKTLVIAEKPSVAADIAKALGGFTKRGDNHESATMLIAAAAGHLLEATRPKTWKLADLPLLPERLEMKPAPRQAKRLAELVSLLHRDDVTDVINACDAGREGELIFREIMQHAGCEKPVQRLWLQSMTAAAIRRAFKELRPAAAMQGLADAAASRSLADWWIGINITKALSRGVDPANKRVFDSAKVGDHFAIVPAEIASERPDLTESEQTIYELVLKWFVAALLPPSETAVHTLVFTVAGETFEAVARTIRVPGWRAVYGKTIEALPSGHGGSADASGLAKVTCVVVEERQTTPPRGHFTDGTLVKAMETAGKLVDDEEAQEAMRGTGLGTAATRTHTITKLLHEGYLVRRGRELRATPKAMSLKMVLERLRLEVLTSPAMTGTWEARLAGQPALGACPHCGGAVHERAMRYACENATAAEPTCNFRMLKLWCSRAITRDDAVRLLVDGRTALLKGFHGKNGRPFKAALVIRPGGKVAFEFEKTRSSRSRTRARSGPG